ncbi:MAG TPA: hypothetical protein VEJ84_10880, partial [Acidimicrobiales bacterium]|nr:hypothetical protein [Acidimicrobiales bacterium]
DEARRHDEAGGTTNVGEAQPTVRTTLPTSSDGRRRLASSAQLPDAGPNLSPNSPAPALPGGRAPGRPDGPWPPKIKLS